MSSNINILNNFIFQKNILEYVFPKYKNILEFSPDVAKKMKEDIGR